MKYRRELIIAATVIIIFVGGLLLGKSRSSTQTSMQVYSESVDEASDDGKARVVIKAPEKIKIGDIITIDLSESSGEGFDYEVEPLPPGIRTFDNGKIIVCGTGDKNVTYTFMISCALEGSSNIKVHKIKVYGAQDTETPETPGENIVVKVKDWVSEVDSPSKREDAIKLAQSFASVAIVINQGTFTDVKSLIDATAKSNRDALGDKIEYWAPLLDALHKELNAMAQLGKLSDIRIHGRIWSEVAQGLREYAETIK